ncbi:MAG TPA: S-adenosylmethionine:tRNA ribosyltransferase-isomerase [Gaiellaceae bacterium]|nr:S-adenosylmethionine:tRNA ribosyltransferase-isomerase [Gaiellaceae bacterium]
MSAIEAPRRPEAHEPPEARGEGRDDVAMLVARRHDLGLVDARFRELPRFLSAGDLLVVNVSATLPAALDARLDRQSLQLWLSTPTRDGAWLVELRSGDRKPFRHPPLGARLDLPGGAHAELVGRFGESDRLVVARLEVAGPLEDYLRRHGRPVRYRYVPEQWPLAAYQTVFAREPGSAEMPSAGRPFTAELVTDLVARGILVAPVTLHTGLSSPERGEPPYPERFYVPATTAALVNAVRGWSGRVIAVGTTVVRAVETVAAPDGTLSGGWGWTSLVVAPECGLRAVDGLLTGWHEETSSHLELLEAAAGAELLERSYRAAVERGYLWHEFGDLHLILP